MNPKEFLTSYLDDFSDLVKPDEKIIDQLGKVADLIKVISAKGNKVLIFGNGGSAAISSHFSVDLTKNAGVRCVNCNEADLITCFANDYGYENIFSRQLEASASDKDMFLAITTSGKSENLPRASRANATMSATVKAILPARLMPGMSDSISEGLSSSMSSHRFHEPFASNVRGVAAACILFLQ